MNVYQELTQTLNEVKTLLDLGADLIRPAVKTLGAIIPQINEMLTLVIAVIGKIKAEIAKLDTSMIPIDKVLPFINGAKSLLGTAKKLLPDSQAEITQALEVVEVVASCPTPEQIKAEAIGLLDAVTMQIASLKAA